MEPRRHQYPGVDLPLRHLGEDNPREGLYERIEESESELLHVREVAMMLLMDRLTDKPNWHEKVFDDAIVAKWRTEALTQSEEAVYNEILAGKNVPMPKRTRIISAEAFDYTIAELRCKAAFFKDTGLVLTINSAGREQRHNTAVKADSVVSSELQQDLKAAFEKLRAEQGAEPDWHPRSNDLVQDLVHPSMYPFVYGKSKFIQDEVVGVTDAIDKWSGKGEVVPATGETPEDDAYWSRTYQWLPANLAFQDDGTVRLTSYINNLHPKKHPEIYRLVEKLIDTAIPAWDAVLTSAPIVNDPDDNDTQIRFAMPLPVFEYEDQEQAWEKFDADILAAHEEKEGPVPFHPLELQHLGMSDDEDEDGVAPDAEVERLSEEEKIARKIQRIKWREVRDPILPEPMDFKPITYKVTEALGKNFKDTGLQVIVKMASIELTPEKPVFQAGGWHVEGQMNEHIVATALYYLDSENVTPSQLSFRMATSPSQDDLQEQVGQDLYRAYEYIYGTRLGFNDSETVQTYGSVNTPEGRLLAFPNVFQHAVSSFSLQDPTKSGHRRFIALWLVDPHQRVISTGNVPPQQFDWWAEAVFGTESKAAKGDMPTEVFQLLLEQGADKVVKPTEELLKSMSNQLPAEVLEMVRRERVKTDGLMTVEEAREHRLALMDERSAFVAANQQELRQSYGFCEH